MQVRTRPRMSKWRESGPTEPRREAAFVSGFTGSIPKRSESSPRTAYSFTKVPSSMSMPSVIAAAASMSSIADV